ncbi:PD-(D/E)XK nuclease domain-containing protein [Sorangium sp. So ce124]|uniref:PD-(D/E)XK nuclease domain-containing protein n=1 Tax=Sorangium sp. So ce124 TaxID=3133280 RepID=UPI003F63FA83
MPAYHVLSYHEARRLGPEEVYRGFVAGLLATLEPDYEVRSNRESGEGRPDVLVRPRQPGKPGVVPEMKVARGGQTLRWSKRWKMGCRRSTAGTTRPSSAPPARLRCTRSRWRSAASRWRCARREGVGR